MADEDERDTLPPDSADAPHGPLAGAIREIIDAIPDIIGVQDTDHRILFYNRRGFELVGRPPAEVLGRRCFELIGRSGPCADCPVEQALATSKPHRRRRFEKSLGVWIDVRAYPLFDSGGRIIGAVEHLRDITREHQAEAALRAGEERYRLLTENQRDIVVACDLAGTIVYCSPAVREFGGYDPEQALGTRIFDYFEGTSDLQTVAAGMERMLGSREPVAFEVMYRPSSGPAFPVEISARPVVEDGEVVGFHGIARDIRERRRAEEERAALEEQLTQAAKMEAIGRLAGGVAHDFNNLLAGISGYAELALRNLGDADRVRRDLEAIIDGARRAAELTGQLLAFSRRQTAVPRLVDLNAEIERIRRMLARLIPENVRLGFEPGAGLWPVRLDPVQLERILVNLAANARDSITGRGAIGIATLNEPAAPGSAAGDRVLLLFRDSGAGMDRATAARIFEPFFTTKAAGRGTGLGLATVQGIVEQNRGTIRVETAPGAGTIFEIRFPRADGDVRSTHQPPAGPRPPVDGAGTVVLVAEDEPTVRALICRILSAAGYRTIPAADGEEAERLARESAEPIRLLVSDVVMPGMDGVELHGRLAADRPGLAVLFVSGYAEDVLARDGLLPESVPLLQKPFTADALLEAVAQRLAADPEPGGP